MTHQEQLEIGAYLLGALPPRERSAFEAHLAQCSGCRNEVADLAGIPALLGKVTLSDVMTAAAETGPGLPSLEIPPAPRPQPSPGTEPVPPVVRLPDADTPIFPPPRAAPRPARKPITAGPFGWRHRTVLLAAAAVLAILAVVGSVALLSGRRGPDAAAPATPAPTAAGEIRTVSLLPAVPNVHGSVQIAGGGLGSLLRLSMGGVPPGQQCSLLVAGTDGARQQVASWTANYEGDVEKLADSALQPASIRWIGVATPGGTVLLQAKLAA